MTYDRNAKRTDNRRKALERRPTKDKPTATGCWSVAHNTDWGRCTTRSRDHVRTCGFSLLPWQHHSASQPLTSVRPSARPHFSLLGFRYETVRVDQSQIKFYTPPRLLAFSRFAEPAFFNPANWRRNLIAFCLEQLTKSTQHLYSVWTLGFFFINSLLMPDLKFGILAISLALHYTVC